MREPFTAPLITMTRTERLLKLLQRLRRQRFAISASELSESLGVSVRTVYRDIEALRDQGARIEGESGVGYLLRQDFLLPPLTLSAEEAEALLLGVRWVAKNGDPELAAAAKQAFSKIESVLPAELRADIGLSPLLAGSARPQNEAEQQTLVAIRQAIRMRRKVQIDYLDTQQSSSIRIIWPIAVGFFEQTRVVAAWCELRQEFRHFRCDRMANSQILEVMIPKPAEQLLQQWHREQCIPLQSW